MIFKRDLLISLILTLLILLAATIPLLQRIPNGADHYFMIDVGETQIVLNIWGTLHATNYPLYVMLGNLFTAPLRWLGVVPLVAAALYSLLWGVLAAGVMSVLAYRLTHNALLAAVVTVLYSLTRTVWIHNVIAEIYTSGLFLLILLLAVALWDENNDSEHTSHTSIYWLALLGGVGVSHHRALAMVAPALLFAVWRQFIAKPRQLPLVILKSLGLGLIGFVPYIYPFIRARQGGAWVYGDTGNLPGLWDQFIGKEGARFMGLQDSLPALLANVENVSRVILMDVTLVGVVLGIAGLVAAVMSQRYRHAGITFALSGFVAYVFHVLYYSDILSALILPVTLSIAFGWLLGADLLLRKTWAVGKPIIPTHRWGMLTGLAVLSIWLGGVLIARNVPFIQEQVTDTRGLEVIALMENVPEGSTVMIPWGPQHSAVGYAKDITSELPQITELLDHTEDTRPAIERGTLVLPEYLRFRYPPGWWVTQAEGAVYVNAVAPGLVRLSSEPIQLDNPPNQITADERLACHTDSLHLRLIWTAPESPLPDLSVFVHLLDGAGNVIAQDDRFAPVYGWRPVSGWVAGEQITDRYTLPRLSAGVQLRYGLYRQDEDGSFVNEFERELEVTCDA